MHMYTYVCIVLRQHSIKCNFFLLFSGVFWLFFFLLLGWVRFLCLMAYQLFVGYLMPNHSPGRTVVVLFNP